MACCAFGDGMKASESLDKESEEEKRETIEESEEEKPERKKRKLFINGVRVTKLYRERDVACCGFGDGMKVSELLDKESEEEKRETIEESEEEKPERKKRKLFINGVRVTKSYERERDMACCGCGYGMKASELLHKESEVWVNSVRAFYLKIESDLKKPKTKPKTNKGKLRLDNKGRLVKKLSDKISTKKKRRSFEELEKLFELYDGEIEGGSVVEYDRDSDSSDPRDHLKDFANLAIRSYNKREDKNYLVVAIVRATSSLSEGTTMNMTLTAKLPEQGDAAAVTFKTRVYEGIRKTEVVCVHMLDAPAVSPLTN